jgi:hypothetical protein
MAKLMYNEKLVQGSSEHPVCPILSSSTQENLQEGWPLKSTKSNDKLEIGQQTGNKEDPTQVSQAMHHTKNAEGTRRFTLDEFLTPKQISPTFHKQRKIKNSSEQPDLEQHEFAAAEEETAYHCSKETVLGECKLVHQSYTTTSHPVSFLLGKNILVDAGQANC